MSAPALLTLVVLSAAGAPPPPPAAPAEDVVALTETWRARRLERLRAPDGWLTLVGLAWLKEGDNVAGASPSATVKFPAGAPDRLGTFTRTGTQVRFTPAPGVAATKDGQPFTGGVVRDDGAEAGPEVLGVDRFRFFVVLRGDRVGVRIKDPEARARKEFQGIPSYPVSARWRLRARWEPSNPPVQLAVPNVLGQIESMPSPGTAVFTVDGQEYRLTPVLEPGSPNLFFVFGDLTNRTETYGAGRFVYADPPKDGVVVLDFNRAYNPPCAFSAYATCPLPPKQNKLALRIDAGEKRTGSH